MINDKSLEQSNSSGSTGYQSGGAMTVHGISYTEARQIALDLWKSNALKLSQQAAQEAFDRASKLMNNFLIRISDTNPKLFNSLKDPGMQWALFSAQKDYAKTGSESVFDLLTEMLLDRAKQNERSILQIVLDESINVVCKLTEENLDILTLIFILGVAKPRIVSDAINFNNFLEIYIKPFCTNLRPLSSCINHIQYSNCATFVNETRTQQKMQFVNLFKRKYPLFFYEWI